MDISKRNRVLKERIAMLWRTHLLTGITTGYLIAGPEPFAMITAGISSLLPDLDHPNSYIGRKIPVLPALFHSTLGYRGIFHSFLAAIITTLTIGFFSNANIALAAGTGYLTHLMGDLITPSGVPIFWPWKKRIRIPLVKTGGILERLVIIPITGLGLLNFVILSELKKLLF